MSNRKSATNGNQTRGIRSIERNDRAKRFGVQWRVDGKRKTKFFDEASKRDKFAAALAGDVKAHGLAALRLNPDEAREWRAFRADIGAAPLSAVLATWRRFGSASGSVSLSAAIEAFKAIKKTEGVGARHLSHLGPTFARLLEALGDVSAGSVTREDLAGFVSKLDQANSSCRTNYARIKCFFRWLKTTRQITESPCDGLKSPKEIRKPISVMPVEHGVKFFAANLAQPREVLGRLALEAFAGMRHETAGRLPNLAINFETRIITIPAEIDKNRQEQWIEKTPDCLWAWLTWSRPHEWDMNFYTYRNAKCNAFAIANVPHPKNVLRHSFPSYHIAVNGDAGKTATILTHSNLRMLWKHYRGKGGSADYAAGWFDIYPPADAGEFPGLLIDVVSHWRRTLAALRAA